MGLDDAVHCPIAHGEGRYVHPDADALAADGQVALRYRGSNPNGSVGRHRRGVRCVRDGARPDAASREPCRRPPAPAPPARRWRSVPPRSAGVRERRRLRRGRHRRIDARPTRSNRSPTIELPLPDRRDGKVRASYALDAGPAADDHHRSTVGVRSGDRRRALQGAGAQRAVGMVVRTHGRRRRQPRRRRARPERAGRTLGAAAPGRGRRARLHHRCHRHVAVASVRRRGAHDLRPPLPRRAGEEHAAARADRDAHHEGRARRPRRADHVRRGRRPAGSSTPSCGSG